MAIKEFQVNKTPACYLKQDGTSSTDQLSEDEKFVYNEFVLLGAVPDSRPKLDTRLQFAPVEKLTSFSTYLLKNYTLGRHGTWKHKYLPVVVHLDGQEILTIKINHNPV